MIAGVWSSGDDCEDRFGRTPQTGGPGDVKKVTLLWKLQQLFFCWVHINSIIWIIGGSRDLLYFPSAHLFYFCCSWYARGEEILMGNSVALDRIPLELDEVLNIEHGGEVIGSSSPGLTARTNVEASSISSNLLLWRFFLDESGDGPVRHAPIRFDSRIPSSSGKFEGNCCYLILHVYKFFAKAIQATSRNSGITLNSYSSNLFKYPNLLIIILYFRPSIFARVALISSWSAHSAWPNANSRWNQSCWHFVRTVSYRDLPLPWRLCLARAKGVAFGTRDRISKGRRGRSAREEKQKQNSISHLPSWTQNPHLVGFQYRFGKKKYFLSDASDEEEFFSPYFSLCSLGSTRCSAQLCACG